MRTDTEYLRGIADNENLPTLMRDTLRSAAAEIEMLRADWARLEWLADRDNVIGTVQLPTMCVMNNIDDKQAAAEEAQNRAILRDKKQRIKDALAFAENRELDNKTVEELKAMLNDLGE